MLAWPLTNAVLSVLAASETVSCVVLPSESSMLGGGIGIQCLCLWVGIPMTKTLVFSCHRKRQTDRSEVGLGNWTLIGPLWDSMTTLSSWPWPCSNSRLAGFSTPYLDCTENTVLLNGWLLQFPCLMTQFGRPSTPCFLCIGPLSYCPNK